MNGSETFEVQMNYVLFDLRERTFVLSYLFSACVLASSIALLGLNFIVAGFALEYSWNNGPLALRATNLAMFFVPMFPIAVLGIGYFRPSGQGTGMAGLFGPQSSFFFALIFGLMGVAFWRLEWPLTDFAPTLLTVPILIGLAWTALKFKKRDTN